MKSLKILQIQFARADLREFGEGSSRKSYIMVLLCSSTVVLRGKETSVSRYSTSRSGVAQKGMFDVSKRLKISLSINCEVFLIHLVFQDFETCVLNGDRECRYIEGETHEGIGDHRRQTLFFCGHEDECT